MRVRPLQRAAVLNRDVEDAVPVPRQIDVLGRRSVDTLSVAEVERIAEPCPGRPARIELDDIECL